MSKSVLTTRDRIVAKALEMFNEEGVEYVGLRELAAVLDMRVSNITYYFPTKDDLVFEISRKLAEANSKVIVSNENLTIYDFLGMMQAAFKNHIRFRCLLLSFVHIMQQNKKVAAGYKKTQGLRNATLQKNIEALVKGGYIKADGAESRFLISSLALISRFWISEASVSYRQMSEKDQMAHYLQLISQLLTPYATAKGKKDIRAFNEQLEHLPL